MTGPDRARRTSRRHRRNVNYAEQDNRVRNWDHIDGLSASQGRQRRLGMANQLNHIAPVNPSFEPRNIPVHPEAPAELYDELNQLVTQFASLTITNNPAGSLTDRKQIINSFGDKYATIFKGGQQNILQVLCCLCGPFYTRPFGNSNTIFLAEYSRLRVLLDRFASGLSENAPNVHQNLNEFLYHRYEIDFQLFVPVQDTRLSINQNSVFTISPNVSESMYVFFLSTIVKTLGNFNETFLRNLILICVPNITEIDRAELELGGGGDKFKFLIEFIIESVKVCFKTNFFCATCIQSFSDINACVGHCAKFHKDSVIPFEVEKLQEQRLQRQLNKKDEEHERLVAEMRAEHAQELNRKNAIIARQRARLVTYGVDGSILQG